MRSRAVTSSYFENYHNLHGNGLNSAHQSIFQIWTSLKYSIFLGLTLLLIPLGPHGLLKELKLKMAAPLMFTKDFCETPANISRHPLLALLSKHRADLCAVI